MSELFKKALVFRQKQLKLCFKARAFYKDKQRLRGLLPSLRDCLFAKGTPKFPRKKTGSKSSKWRGKALEKALASPKNQCDPVLVQFFAQLKARQLEIITFQLVCSMNNVATAADVVALDTTSQAEPCLVVLELKTGFSGTTNLDEQFSKRAKTIRKGPFEGFPLNDTWRHRHALQCALTSHFVESCYSTKTLHVTNAFVVYLDLNVWCSIKPYWWANKQDLDKVVALF